MENNTLTNAPSVSPISPVSGGTPNPKEVTTPVPGVVAVSTAPESAPGSGSQGADWIIGEILDGEIYYYCESPCRLFEEIEKATHFNLDYAAYLVRQTKTRGTLFIQCVKEAA